MLLYDLNNPLIKCKVAKHILFPIVDHTNAYTPLSHEIKQFYTSNIHITYNKHYSALYYMRNDVVHFYNTTLSKSKSLVPLYDYTSKEYSLLNAGENYESSKVIKNSWYCVKAPNGNIYIVYIKLHSPRDKALCVYNLTRDKIIHCVTYMIGNDASDTRQESKLQDHPDEYSYILANSFVIIYKLVDIGFRIDIVDLISEKADTFSYTIHDYLQALLDVVKSKTEKKRLMKMLSKDFNDLMTYRMILLWDVEHVECTIDNREGLVPFINSLKIYFSISEKSRIFKRVSSALIASFSFEDDSLSFKLTIGTEKVIELAHDPAFKVNIPSNVILLSKRYSLGTSYDISKSYPYYVYEVTPKYIFTRRFIFEQ